MGLCGPSAQQPQHGQGSALPTDEGTAKNGEHPPGDESSPVATRAEAAGVELTSGTGHPCTPAPLAAELSAGSASSALLLCTAPGGWLKNPAAPLGQPQSPPKPCCCSVAGSSAPCSFLNCPGQAGTVPLQSPLPQLGLSPLLMMGSCSGRSPQGTSPSLCHPAGSPCSPCALAPPALWHPWGHTHPSPDVHEPPRAPS